LGGTHTNTAALDALVSIAIAQGRAKKQDFVRSRILTQDIVRRL
jgi:hypothetical protein